MSKILVCGDIHWSTYSSILRNRGQNFSVRLEQLIASLNWVEALAREQGCLEEIFLGDTFDKPELDAESITALSEVEWNKDARARHFIVGNHESGMASLRYNSTQILHKMGVIEDSPFLYPYDDNLEILFLPYITEDERKPLAEYLKGRDASKRILVCSHNDIKGFQMGAFLSKTGFDLSEIEASCNLYLNGHLHNCGWPSKKVCNVGVLCGQNFSEDAFKYGHHVAIVDTDTLDVRFFENPHALNFYKIDIMHKEDFNCIKNIKKYAVASVKCPNGLKDELRAILDNDPRILTYKMAITIEASNGEACEAKPELGGLDYLDRFKEFILANVGDNDIVREELTEVCKA